MDIVDTHEEAQEQDRPPLIIRRPLEAYLDEQGLGSGEIEAERIGDGHSNVTYLITRGGERFVLRRPPRPPLPPSAHDVLREANLLNALEATDVRTPRVLAACEDESVIGGVPFYVMEYVEGVVMSGEVAPALDDPEGRRQIAEELIDALVETHARRLARRRARGVRQADGLPRPPAAPLQRPLGAQQDARAADRRRGRATGSRSTSPSRPTRRSCTATTAWATRCSPTTRPPR